MLHDRIAESIVSQLGYTPGGHVPIEVLIEHVGPVIFSRAVDPGDAIWTPSGVLCARDDRGQPWAFACLLAGLFAPNTAQDRLTRIAAALLMPRPLFLRALTEIGPSPIELAERFRVRQCAAALRIGEAANRPVVLASNDRVYVRGPSPLSAWPKSAAAIRRLAKCPPKGTVAKAIGDEPGPRVAIIASIAS